MGVGEEFGEEGVLAVRVSVEEVHDAQQKGLVEQLSLQEQIFLKD